MSMELLYTSAARGLKPGSRGFCTVAMTQGMPPQLVERLESLSGYRQVFAPQDQQAALNPVVNSHLRISVAGRTFHVLSRISAAGLDYSGRNNKLAHHLVLDPSELSPAGPAWTLAQPGMMQSAWDGNVRLLPAGRRVASGQTAAGICRLWQQFAGDAGWGGVLAEAAIERPKTPVTLIFRPGLDPLGLVAESLALLPPERRWAVTFSTYFTKLPPGVECQWRCALEGSAEANARQGLVIDLCRPLAAATGGPYLTAARSGQLPVAARAVNKPALPKPVGAYRAGDLELAHLLQPDEPAPQNELHAAFAADSFGALQPLPPMQSGEDLYGSTAPTGYVRRNRNQSARWPIYAASTALALILFGGGALLLRVISGGKEIAQTAPAVLKGTTDTNDNMKTDGKKTEREAEPRPSDPVVPKMVEPRQPASQQTKTDSTKPQKATDLSAAHSVPPANPTGPGKTAGVMPADAPKPGDSRKPDTDKPKTVIAPRQADADALKLLEDSVLLDLNVALGERPRPISMGQFDFSLARGSTLSLLGAAAAFGAEKSVVLIKPDLANSNGQLEWTCQIDAVPRGVFRFVPNELSFEWRDTDRTSAPRLNQIRNCVLAVSLGSQHHYIALRTPQKKEPRPLNLVDSTGNSITPNNSPSISVRYPPLEPAYEVELMPFSRNIADLHIHCDHPDKDHLNELLVSQGEKAPSRDDIQLMLRATLKVEKPDAGRRASNADDSEPKAGGADGTIVVVIDTDIWPGKSGVTLPKHTHLTPFLITNKNNDGVLDDLIKQRQGLIGKKSEFEREDKKYQNDHQDQIEAIKRDLKTNQHEIESAEIMKTLVESLLAHDSKATVGYRIYMNVEGQQVDLITTAPEPTREKAPAKTTAPIQSGQLTHHA